MISCFNNKDKLSIKQHQKCKQRQRYIEINKSADTKANGRIGQRTLKNYRNRLKEKPKTKTYKHKHKLKEKMLYKKFA